MTGIVVDIVANAGLHVNEECTYIMADYIDNGRQVECTGRECWKL